MSRSLARYHWVVQAPNQIRSIAAEKRLERHWNHHRERVPELFPLSSARVTTGPCQSRILVILARCISRKRKARLSAARNTDILIGAYHGISCRGEPFYGVAPSL